MRSLRSGGTWIEIREDKGCRLRDRNELPGTAELVAKCRKLFEE